MQTKTLIRLCTGLSCLLLALTAACKKEEQQQGNPMGMMGTPEVVAYQVAEQMILPQVELPGRTAAYRVAEVRPQVSGILQKRLFTEGSEVKAGQVLYQIDPAIYKATVESAQARLAQATAVEYSARQKAARYRSLVQTKAVSAQEQVEMEAAWKQAQAEIAAARAALETAKINLEYTKIKAPISGRIGRSMVTEGALMTAQQPNALAVIQQLDPLYVDVNQPADDMLALREKMAGRKAAGDTEPTRVQVLLADGSEHGAPGTLEFSDVTVDQGTGTVTVRAIVPNPDRSLLPGMFIRARLTSPTEEPALLVPQSAVQRTPRGEQMLMLVNQASTSEVRMIQTGRNYGQQVLVTSGLKAGERVIVDGLQKVRADMEVKVVDAPPAATAGAQPGGNQTGQGAPQAEQKAE